MKLDRGDYVRDITPHANLVFLLLRRRFCICVKLSSSVVYFLHPVNNFRPQWLKRRVSATVTSNYGVRTKKVNNFHYFSPKTRNSQFPQCKISIGNKDRVVKFAYSRGYSAIADRMVWPPSLSRDRKWPRPPIRRKTTYWMRVTTVAYEIRLSLVGSEMCIRDRFGVKQHFECV